MTGSGTALDPYVIWDVTDLQNINLDLTADYELANDIDASGVGFVTLGDSTHPFTGQIDAKDYRVSELTISNVGGGSRKAAFIYRNTGIVKNLHFQACNITAESTDNSADAGAFAYTNSGTIEDCSVTGAVTAIGNSAPAGYWSEAGGIVAINIGTINRCYSTCVVSVASDDYASGAGIVDWNDFGGIVDECYATGSIIVVAGAGSEGYGAGLVSDNEGTIRNSYSLATVNVSGGGTNYGGGFVDENELFDGIIENCYSTGTVVADSTGGFCRTNGGTITSCFWDTQTSGQATSDGGTGKTTAQMKTRSTFTGWDIEARAVDKNNGYPYLAWQSVWYIFVAVAPPPPPISVVTLAATEVR